MGPFKNNEKAWKIYLSALESMLGDDTSPQNEVFQPLAVLKQADWDNVGAPNFNLYREYVMSDTLTRWGAMGTDSGKSLVEVYGDFLARIIKRVAENASSSTDLNDEDKKKIKELEVIHDEALKSKVFYKSKANSDWKDYLLDNQDDPHRLSKQEFYNQNTNWILSNGFNDQAKSYAFQILRILDKTSDPDLRILNAVRQNYEDNPLMKNRLPERIEWEDEEFKKTLLHKQDVSGDIFKFKSGTLNQSVTINSSTSESKTVSTSWGGSIGFSAGPFNFGGGASGSKLEQEARDKATAVSMSFENIQEFSIERDDWFSMYILERFGPDLPEYWGPNGFLNVIPTSIVLVKGVKINVVSSNNYSKRVEEHFKAKKTVGWGPFKFSGSYSRTSIYSKVEVNGDSFTITSLGDDAYLLGFRCAQLHSKEQINYLNDSLITFQNFKVKTKS